MTQSIFSSQFEENIRGEFVECFHRFLEMKNDEQLAGKGFVKRENACRYFDGISIGTLQEYEKLGLKRYKPAGGNIVFYKVDDLEKFMLSHEDKQ